MKLSLMHTSLQFGDTNKQHTSDLERIFTRAVSRDVAWITGTEAGPGARNTADELYRLAPEYGYRPWTPSGRGHGTPGNSTDSWLAVREDLITGHWATAYDEVIPGSSALYKAQGLKSDLNPRWGPKGLVHVRFDSIAPLGVVSVGAGHYLTKGHHPGAVERGVDHWEWNQKLAKHIGEWAEREGRGRAKVFYGGDQNMVDSRNDRAEGDTFFGAPLTSAADELGHWENSGHGAIDVIASYDADHAVKAVSWQALDDKEFFLETDHFACEAEYEVKGPRR